MARVNVTQSYNAGNAKVLFNSPNSGVHKNLRARALATQTAAKQRLRADPRRIDTGNLINSIEIAELPRGGVIVMRIGTNVEYSIFVHNGTRYMEANPFLRDGLRNAMRQF